jgi:hypothetical protein
MSVDTTLYEIYKQLGVLEFMEDGETTAFIAEECKSVSFSFERKAS